MSTSHQAVLSPALVKPVVKPAIVAAPVVKPVVAPAAAVKPVVAPAAAVKPVVAPAAAVKPVVAPAAAVKPVVAPAAAVKPVVAPAAAVKPVVAPAAAVKPVVAPAAAVKPVVAPAAAVKPVVAPAAAVKPVVAPAAAVKPVVAPAAAVKPVVAPAAAVKPVVAPAAAVKPVIAPAAQPIVPGVFKAARVRVLLIGINYSNTPIELYGCVNDIQNVQNWFKANTPSSVPLSFYVLSDSKVGKTVVKGAQGSGTGANILAGIQWLVSDARANDVMYVHYSGHGTTVYSNDAGEPSGSDSTWMPLDSKTFRGGGSKGLILDNELRALLTSKVPAGSVLWVTSDSCYSGTVLDLRYNYSDASFQVDTPIVGAPEPWTPSMSPAGVAQVYKPALLQPATLVIEIKTYEASKGQVYLLSGCTDTQQSADAWENRQACGALTWAFLSTIKQNKSTPLKYMMKDVRGLLGLHGYPQTPQLSTGQSADLSMPFTACLGLL